MLKLFETDSISSWIDTVFNHRKPEKLSLSALWNVWKYINHADWYWYRILELSWFISWAEAFGEQFKCPSLILHMRTFEECVGWENMLNFGILMQVASMGHSRNWNVQDWQNVHLAIPLVSLNRCWLTSCLYSQKGHFSFPQIGKHLGSVLLIFMLNC